MDGAYLRHASLSPRISGNARLIPGIIDNALQLDGSNQYVDLGDLRNECLGNLDLCPNGITFSSWINFQNFDENMYIFSSSYNGIRMFYKDGNINTVVQHNGKEWSTKVPKLDLDNWNYVEFTWHPDFGLKMFLNNTLVGEDPTFTNVPVVPDSSTRVYIGRDNVGDTAEFTRTANMKMDEAEIWYGRREELMAFDYIVRGTVIILELYTPRIIEIYGSRYGYHIKIT